jgi:ABC-type Fe3+/spermidine/putrescine transport system ATPase subunit
MIASRSEAAHRMDNDMEVSVARITKGFVRGSGPALDGITFTAEANRITSLVGASGCGKTTTLRCIAGLEVPDSGEVWFGKQVVARGGRIIVPTVERHIGMVFQSYALWPHLTVGQNVAFGLKARKWKKAPVGERVRQVLELVELPGFEDRYPAQLSGGQQQRVALARALAYEPAVLLMDEPLANLDAHLRGQMRQAIKRLQRQTGVTMIYVTHDRAEAMELSDTIVILDKGRIVQAGSPNALFEAPADSLVARFLGHSNLLSVTIATNGGGSTHAVTSFGTLPVSCDAIRTGQASLLVQAEGIHLSTGAQRREGWLQGRGTVLTASRGSAGIACSVQTTCGTLEVHLPPHANPALDSEVEFQIDPSKCKVLPLHVDADR